MLPTLTLVTAFAGAASAILVAPSSPCEQYCGNVLSSTTGSDMVCSDTQYAGTLAGTVFESCIKCELTSAYTSGNTSDLEYLLYNLRYQISYCLFGQQNNTNVQDSPCITSTACGLLEPALDWKNMSTSVGAYDFCQGWVEAEVPKCRDCLVAGDDYFTRNYVTILDAACAQMPAGGSTLSITGTPFSTVPMNITTPSQTPLYTYTPPHEAISLGGKVGIAIGALVLLLSLAGFLIVFFGRRRRRAYLKSIQTRYGKGPAGGAAAAAAGMWPSPFVGGPHTDTPMSQRPLRGWDDQTPVSATTDGGQNGPYGRYFSPYSSQYNSPVSAAGSPPMVSWPTMEAMAKMHAAGSANGGSGGSGSAPGHLISPIDGSQSEPSRHMSSGGHAYTQEDIERAAHERQLASIGIAVGGADPSLRSKNSNMSVMSAAASGKAAEAAAEAAGAFASGSGTRQLAAPPTAFQPAPVHGLSAASSLSSLSISAGVLWERPGKAKLINVASPTVYTQAHEPSPGASSSESYELNELNDADSNGTPLKQKEPVPAAAPLLQHPGFGRGSMQYYPPPPPPQMSDPYENVPHYSAPVPPPAAVQWPARGDAKRSDGM